MTSAYVGVFTGSSYYFRQSPGTENQRLPLTTALELCTKHLKALGWFCSDSQWLQWDSVSLSTPFLELEMSHKRTLEKGL